MKQPDSEISKGIMNKKMKRKLIPSHVGFFLSVLIFSPKLEIVEGIVSTASRQINDIPFGLSRDDDVKNINMVNDKGKHNVASIVVAKTEEADLEQISSLLALETTTNVLSADKRAVFNWNASFNHLKAKSCFLRQLHHRLKASEEANKIINNIQACESANDSLLHDRHEKCRVLWRHDSFRTKLEKAVEITSSVERTVWESHNFALTPEDPSMLNHVMMSVKTVGTGRLVGFCEVAMLPNLYAGNNLKEEAFVPCLVNLAVSREHRRQGIATKLVKSAMRFTRKHWRRHELGLFVEKNNKGATALYLKEGFSIQNSLHEEGDKLYLEKKLRRDENSTGDKRKSYVEERTMTLTK